MKWRLLLVLLLAGGALSAWGLSARPPGQLVVRVDGPDVRVTVAGEGVVRQAEGPCEFELPPGRYEVWASLNNRPGPEQSVDLDSGGRVEVDALVSRPVRPARRPFVLLGRDGRDEAQYASLAKAIDQAEAGDTIEVHGDGPFQVPTLTAVRPLEVRAGPGYRPVLQLRPDAKDQLLVARAALVLEGLTLDGETFPATQQQYRGLLRATGPALLAANCSFRQKGPSTQVSISSPLVHLRNCTLHNATWGAFDWEAPAGGRLELAGNRITAGHTTIHVRAGGLKDVGVELKHNTWTGVWTCLEFRLLDVSNPPEKCLRLRATANIFHSRGEVVILNQWGKEPGDVEETLRQVQKLLVWSDDANLYAAPKGWARVGYQFKELPQGDRPGGLEAWRRLWNLGPTTSVAGEPRFAAKTFRLRPDSPGPRGVGVNPDLVGPGPAYERWKRTPEYQSWREKIPLGR